MKGYLKEHHLIFGSVFFVLLFLGVTFIFNAFWSGEPFPSWATKHDDIKDYATVYISLLAFLGTIYTASLVLYAYDGWKEQKRYDLGHKYADKSLVILNTIFKELNSRYSHFQIQTLLTENLLVAVNKVHKYKYDHTSDLYELLANTNILLKLFPDSLNNEDYDNLEVAVLTLSGALQQIENKYLQYYHSLPDKMKDFNDTTTLYKNESIENLALINTHEASFLNCLDKKFNIKTLGQEDFYSSETESELTLNESLTNFTTEVDKYKDKMINIIKV